MNPATTFAPGDLVEFVDDYGPDGIHAKKGERATVASVRSGYDPLVTFTGTAIPQAYAHRLRKVEPEPAYAIGDKVIVQEGAYYGRHKTPSMTAATVVGQAVTVTTPGTYTAPGDLRVQRADGAAFSIAKECVTAAPEPEPEPEAPTYAEGDLVTVISDKPTYRVGSSILPAPRADKGALKRVAAVWPDGDLTIHDPEDVTEGRTVVSPQHVEPYVAPAIFIHSTARQSGKATLGETWRDLGYIDAAYGFPQRFVTGIDAATYRLNGWGSCSTLWTLPATQDEPDEMDRRADALEEAIDLLGDERTVEEYVAVARYLLDVADERTGA
jgi:hypothetical protein